MMLSFHKAAPQPVEPRRYHKTDSIARCAIRRFSGAVTGFRNAVGQPAMAGVAATPVRSRSTSGARVCAFDVPSKERAQGIPGAARTRSLVCRMRKHTSTTPQVRPHHRHSLRNGFNGCCVLAPARPAFVSPSPVHHRSTSLAPAARAPGPHAFAVRIRAARRTARPRPSHPASTSVTTRTPLSMRWDGGTQSHVSEKRKRNIFAKRLD